MPATTETWPGPLLELVKGLGPDPDPRAPALLERCSRKDDLPWPRAENPWCADYSVAGASYRSPEFPAQGGRARLYVRRHEHFDSGSLYLDYPPLRPLEGREEARTVPYWELLLDAPTSTPENAFVGPRFPEEHPHAIARWLHGWQHVGPFSVSQVPTQGGHQGRRARRRYLVETYGRPLEIQSSRAAEALWVLSTDPGSTLATARVADALLDLLYENAPQVTALHLTGGRARLTTFLTHSTDRAWLDRSLRVLSTLSPP